MDLKAVLPGLVFIGVGLYHAFEYWWLRRTGREIEVDSKGRRVRIIHHPANVGRAVMAGWRGLAAPVVFLVLGGALVLFGLLG